MRLIRSCSCRAPLMRCLFEANKVFAVWHIFLGSRNAAVGSIYKVSREGKKKGQPIWAFWKLLETNCQESVHSWSYYWMFPSCWPKDLNEFKDKGCCSSGHAKCIHLSKMVPCCKHRPEICLNCFFHIAALCIVAESYCFSSVNISFVFFS